MLWNPTKPNPIYIYIYIYIYVVHLISFQTILSACTKALRIVIDSWKFSILLLYILWDDWPTFMISGSKWTATVAIGIYPTKAWLHSWWISKIQSGREDTLEERNVIKFCFKLGKNATECFRLLLECLSWIEHQFLSGIRDSKKAGSLWGMMRGVGGVRKSIHQSWLG